MNFIAWISGCVAVAGAGGSGDSGDSGDFVIAHRHRTSFKWMLCIVRSYNYGFVYISHRARWTHSFAYIDNNVYRIDTAKRVLSRYICNIHIWKADSENPKFMRNLKPIDDTKTLDTMFNNLTKSLKLYLLQARISLHAYGTATSVRCMLILIFFFVFSSFCFCSMPSKGTYCSEDSMRVNVCVRA